MITSRTPIVPRLVVLLGIWTLLPQSHCSGQGAVYMDRSAFNSALQSRTTVTFESLTPSSPFSTGLSPITASGLTLTNAESRLFICNPSTGLYPIPGNGQYVWNFDSSYPVGIFLPAGRNAFAADFAGGIAPQNDPFIGTITVRLVGGETYGYNFAGSVGSWTFRGFIFPSAIRSVVFDDGGPFLPGAHQEKLDNVTYGLAVPEPQTSVLILVGVVSTFGFLRPGKRGVIGRVGCACDARAISGE